MIGFLYNMASRVGLDPGPNISCVSKSSQLYSSTAQELSSIPLFIHMDNSYFYGTEDNQEDVFLGHSLQDAAPPCLPPNPHHRTMDTAACLGLPANGDVGFPLDQNTAGDALSSWQNAEVDFSASFQQTFAGPLVWPQVDPFMALTGEGQVFSAEMAVSTMYQTDPFGFGTQEPSSWPLPSVFPSDAASSSYIPEYPQSKYPMELVSSSHADWGVTPSCEIFSGYEWQAFYEAFSTLEPVKKHYAIHMTSSLSSNSCTIPFDMVHSCFAAMPNQGGGPTTSTTSKALAIIKKIVGIPPLGQRIALDFSESGTKSHIWASAISFCRHSTSEWLLTDSSTGSADDRIKKSTLDLFKSTRSRLKDAYEAGTPLSADTVAAAESCLSSMLRKIENEQEGEDLRNFVDEYLRTLREPATNNVTFQLSWIVSRYLELCMFGYIQQFFNSGKRRTQTEIKEFIIIICSVIEAVEGTLWLRPPNESLTSGAVKILFDDFIDRQNRIRTALWICCSIMLSKLNPFNDSVVMDLFKTLPPKSVDGQRKPFWASVESLDQDIMASPDDIHKMVQPFYNERLAVTGGLRRIKEAIVADESIGSENAFQCLFEDAASGFLDDLALDGLEISPQLNQLKAGRLFLALSNLSWGFSSIPGLGGVFEEADGRITSFALYLLQKIHARRSLVFLYRSTMESFCHSRVRRAHFEVELSRVDLAHHYDATGASRLPLVWKGCCIGRRWNTLIELAGEAIILCGSPLVDCSSNWNIPMVVETGSEEEFDGLCTALNADMRWVIEVCGEMKHVPTMLDDFSELLRVVFSDNHDVSRDDVQRAIENITEHIPSAVGIVNPASLLSGELRSIGLGTSSQNIIHEMDAMGLFSSLKHRLFFGVCLDAVRELVIPDPPRSKAELAESKAELLSLLCDSSMEGVDLIKTYLTTILDNVWFQVGRDVPSSSGRCRVAHG
ncbi:hypothetical protein NLG97_g1392 [Lecanicillium saksenae]|uniref:Uncharacterized protein n=1 Tax=Lecanicillium saksenae TaxID=468837 RepID=A0ACC1R3V9_9HYPO|nr:hypothetical protein NLG97_g1392 [Lecanicillium saksenae]